MIIRLASPVTRDAAAEYLRHRLKDGMSLAAALSDHVDLRGGEFFLLSPTSLGAAEMIQFERAHTAYRPDKARRADLGGEQYTIAPVATSDDQLVEVIFERLSTPGAICIFENALAEAGDSCLRHKASPVATFGHEVYHVVSRLEPADIRAAIREARGAFPPLIGAIGNLGVGASGPIQSLTTITPNALADLAATASLVVVAAYDGEGYVVWTAECAR